MTCSNYLPSLTLCLCGELSFNLEITKIASSLRTHGTREAHGAGQGGKRRGNLITQVKSRLPHSSLIRNDKIMLGLTIEGELVLRWLSG